MTCCIRCTTILQYTDNTTCGACIEYIGYQIICNRCGRFCSITNRERHYRSYECRVSICMEISRNAIYSTYQGWLKKARTTNILCVVRKCKSKYINDEEHINKDFGYTRLEEIYKTCVKCRARCKVNNKSYCDTT